MTRLLAACVLVATAAIVGTTNAYGEGMFLTRDSCATNRTTHYHGGSQGTAMRVTFSEPDLDCSHIHASSAPISRAIGVRVASPPLTLVEALGLDRPRMISVAGTMEAVGGESGLSL